MKRLLAALGTPKRGAQELSLNILVTLALALLFSLINPNFISKYSMISTCQNLAPYAILALGVIMPISMGGTDLSIGAVCVGAAVVGGKLYEMGVPLPACIPIMIAFGAVVGLVNGYLVAKKGLQPFVATLGSMMFVRGATAIFANKPNVMFPSNCWYNWVFSTYKDFATSFVWILVFAVAMNFIYRKTKVGRYLLSIGSNEQATRVSGVDVDKYIIIGYVGSGLMAGVASIFWSASFPTITVATGNGMELDAIAAVYIGGTAATGGIANVFGSVIGSLMLVVIRSGLNFALARLSVPINSTYVTYVISGVIVVVAVMADRTKRSSGQRQKVWDPKKVAKVRLASYAASAVLLCLLIVTGVVATGKAGPGAEGEKTVCILMKSEGNDFWNKVAEGAQAAGEELGYRVVCRGPESEDASYLPKQREIMNTMLAEDPVGVGVSTIADGFTDLLENAYEQEIPIVQYDSGLFEKDLAYISESKSNPLRSYVESDNYANGALVAERAFAAVKDDIAASDEYVVGVIQHSSNESARKRAEGFAETFEKLAEADPKCAGKCQVLIEVKPSEANNAYKDALEFLFEKGARLIFGTNMNAANQCSDAVQAAGGKYDGVKFAGFDDGEMVREWMNSDSKSPMLGTVSQNPYMMGYLTVQTIADLSEGKDVKEEVTVPGEWIAPDK